MYDDAYVRAIPIECLARLARRAACCPRAEGPAARPCARHALAAELCPCVAAAGGGTGRGDEAIVAALTAEIERAASAARPPQPAAA